MPTPNIANLSPSETENSNQLELIILSEKVRLFKPADDVLHDPNLLITPQEPGCDEVLLGLPYGECGGVKMANTVFREASKASGRIAGNHVPTHGADANAEFVAMGARFDLPLTEISANTPYVISAHGAAPSVARQAELRGLNVLDVTCPLVSRTHRAIVEAARKGNAVVAYISFGNAEHPEVIAAQGQAQERGVHLEIVNSPASADHILARLQGENVEVTVVGQTTNNSDQAAELANYMHSKGAEMGITVQRQEATDVCHTVRDRQLSTREIIRQGVDSLVVVGSVNSKNTMSLAKVAAEEAEKADVALEIVFTNSWLQLPDLYGRVGVVSGASTRAVNVEGVVTRLNSANGVAFVGEDTDRGVIFKPSQQAARQIFEKSQQLNP